MVSKSASSSSFDSINKTKSSAPIKSTSSASSTSTSSPKVNMNNIINLVKKADKDLDNVLSKQAIVLKLERQSGIKKTVMVYSLAASIVFLILYRLASNFVVSVALFAYPLILSLEAVESHDKTKDAQILAYWSTIALIQLSEALLPFIREYVPLYDLLKIAVAVYLYLPQTKVKNDNIIILLIKMLKLNLGIFDCL